MKPPMKNLPDSFEDYSEDDLDIFLLSFIDEDYEFKPDEPDYWDGFSYPDEEAFLPQEPVNSQDQTIQVNQIPF
jgi:hypothetical protein